jgi:hypothetical protein
VGSGSEHTRTRWSWPLRSQCPEAADLLQLNAPVAARQTIFRVANIFMTSRKLSAPNASALGEIYLSKLHTTPFPTDITRPLFSTATMGLTSIWHVFAIYSFVSGNYRHEIADYNTWLYMSRKLKFLSKNIILYRYSITESRTYAIRHVIVSITTPQSTTANFADDSAVLATDSDPVITIQKLKTNRDAIQNSFKKEMKVNGSKSIHVIFTTGKETCPLVHIKNVSLPQVDVKYLGVQLDRGLA